MNLTLGPTKSVRDVRSTLRRADLAAVLFASCAEMPIDPTLEAAMVVPRTVASEYPALSVPPG